MTPCRTWRGRTWGGGYGFIWREKRPWYLHRWVWTLANGPIPTGMNVLHHCDNPPCYRLDHLYLGDQKQNRADQIERGRDPKLNQTHCKKGHPLPPNTNGRQRVCRTCATERTRLYRERVRGS